VLAIVDYDAGNLFSVARACRAVDQESIITADPAVVRKAERIIFPGVGAAGSAVRALAERGLDAALRDAFLGGTPILGICLGCQIVLTRTEEDDTECLDLVPGSCHRIAVTDPSIKVPHIGWNEVRLTQQHPVLRDICDGDAFYFVHSYFPAPARAADVYGVTDHGQEFACIIGRDNLIAMQFHPEKSGRFGLALLRRFAQWDGIRRAAA